MSIRAEVGSYWGVPFQTYVTIFWGFDSDGKLIDIWVWKTRDVLRPSIAFGPLASTLKFDTPALTKALFKAPVT